MPDFRIQVLGQYVPNVRVQKAPDGYALAVRFNIDVQHEDKTVEEIDLGWFVVPEDWPVQYRDETAWALLPVEMKQASIDKGWNTCTPEELIGILWNTGVLK